MASLHIYSLVELLKFLDLSSWGDILSHPPHHPQEPSAILLHQTCKEKVGTTAPACQKYY